MKKKIIAGLIAVGAITLFLVNPFKTKSVVIEPPDTRAAALPPVTSQQSSISVNVSTPLLAVETAANNLIPKKLSGVEKDPTDWLTGDTIKWKANLGKLTLTEQSGKISASIPITGKATLHGRFGVKKKNKGPLGWLEEAAGFTFRETSSFAGVISGTLSPKINSNWTVNANLNAIIKLSKAEAQLFGKAIKISFRGAIQKEIDKEVKKLTKQLNTHLASDDSLRNEIQQIWESLHLSETLNDEPAIQLGLVPLSLAASVPTVSNSTLSLTLGAQFESELVMQSDTLLVESTPLPAFENKVGANGVSLSVPMAVKLSELDESTFEALGLSSRMEVPGGVIEISDLTASGDNGKLHIGADVQINTGYFNRIHTKIYLTGKPVFDDEKNKIRVDDLQYDLHTENTLARVADFLLKPIVLSEFGKHIEFSLFDDQTKFLAEANTELQKLTAALPESIQTQLSVKNGKISDLRIDNGWLIALVKAEGVASLEVRDLTLFNK